MIFRDNLVETKLIFRDNLVETKLVNQLSLVPIEPPHHGSPPLPIASRPRNHRSQQPSTDFCNKICQLQTSSVTTKKNSSSDDRMRFLVGINHKTHNVIVIYMIRQ